VKHSNAALVLSRKLHRWFRAEMLAVSGLFFFFYGTVFILLSLISTISRYLICSLCSPIVLRVQSVMLP
jgi:hypothetical protein